MSRINRNLQAKYIKACAQRREAAIAEFTKAPYLTGGRTFGNEIDGVAPRQRKPVEWFDRESKKVPYAPIRAPRTLTAAESAWAEAGQVTLYRNGRVVA